MLLLDDLFELEAFLSQRQAEVKAGEHELLSVLARLLAAEKVILSAYAALCRQQ